MRSLYTVTAGGNVLPAYWGADQAALREHDRRVANGCLVCHSARSDRLCPDCYVCIACSPGCEECAPARRKAG